MGAGLWGERRFREEREACPVWAPQQPRREGKTKGGNGELLPAGLRL